MDFKFTWCLLELYLDNLAYYTFEYLSKNPDKDKGNVDSRPECGELGNEDVLLSLAILAIFIILVFYLLFCNCILTYKYITGQSGGSNVNINLINKRK